MSAALVVHCRRKPFDVYIGRPGPWGNPFSWKPGTLAEFVVPKEVVLDRYEAWLRSQPELVARARAELRGKVLGCWCAPNPCHGDIPLARRGGGARVNILEVFSCSGGMAEGFRRAGLHVTMAFDWDADARASYAANLGHAPIGMDARDLERLLRTGWSPGPVELFIADPPCTPWSRAGKRKGTLDERDMLLVTVDIVRLLRPRVALIANVPGLDDAPNWPTVQATIGGLAGDGYCVDFVRLDAADYGVPQHRIRPFWFCHPMGSPHITWPTRTHGPPGERNTNLFEPLTPWVTCRQALGHLAGDELGAPIRLRWRGQNGAKVASTPDEPARVVGTSNLSDGNVLAEETVATRAAERAHKKKTSKKPLASELDAPAGVVTSRENQGDGCVLVTDGSLAYGMEPSTLRPAVRGQQRMGLDGPSVFDGPDHRPTTWDEPAKTITRNTHSDGCLIQVVPHHPPSAFDEPSRAIRASSGGTPDKILARNGKHPPAELDHPAPTLGAKDRGGQGAQVLDWPWERPATTICSDDTIGPPGHHDESFRVRTLPNAIKLSEKAASILQGFPEGWHFAGETKKARWSQIGQAMPPPPRRGRGAADPPLAGVLLVNWTLSWRADPRARAIADRHYNRQTVGAAQFVPPGRCLVLVTPEARAFWITSFPFAEYVKHAWAGAWVCSAFRSEAPELYRSSDLIGEAVAATRAFFGEPPELGMVTFVDAGKVRRKRDPGRCFVRAGFERVGETEGGLVALLMRPSAMPGPVPAVGAQEALFA
jgi:site-specific DNA-cytosine methylase